MTERFSRAIVRIGIAAAGVMAVLFIGTGVLLIWDPAFLLNILTYGIACGCLLLGAVILISLLAAAVGA